VPKDQNAPRLPNEALDSFLDGILAELKDPADPTALDEVRSAFRRRIPFQLRSYAASILILRAAGIPRTASKPATKDASPAPRAGLVGQRGSRQKKDRPEASPPRAQQQQRIASETQRGDATSRPKFRGEGTTIFFSMGKRQRLPPRALIDLLVDVAGVRLEDIGEVRVFDNYSFADLNPETAQRVVTDLNGIELRGRKLSVNLAKKREDAVD